MYKDAKDEEQKLAEQQQQKINHGLTNDKVNCLIPANKLQEYQEQFKKIEEMTGKDSIEDLIKNFIEAEERNFLLSTFVRDLTLDQERLDKEITEVQKEITMYKNQGLGHDNERKKLQKQLEEKIKENEAEYQKNVTEYNNTLEKINCIKDSIEEIFDLVDNETSKKYKELSGSLGVTHDNIMMYLGMVEEMINEMIK